MQENCLPTTSDPRAELLCQLYSVWGASDSWSSASYENTERFGIVTGGAVVRKGANQCYQIFGCVVSSQAMHSPVSIVHTSKVPTSCITNSLFVRRSANSLTTTSPAPAHPLTHSSPATRSSGHRPAATHLADPRRHATDTVGEINIAQSTTEDDGGRTTSTRK